MKKDHFVYQSGVANTKAIVHRGTEKSSQDYIKQNAKHFDHKGKNFSVYKGKSNDASPKKTDFKHTHEGVVMAKTLTPAEKKKREEIAKAMERDNPGMDMSKKMAIATATAKRTTEGLFFGKKGPAVVSRLARGVASRVTTKGRLDRAKKKQGKLDNKINLIKTRNSNIAKKAELRKLRVNKIKKAVGIGEEVPGNAVGQGGVDMAPNAGPRIKSINVTDRRRRKDKQPVMLKRFRKHMNDA
tara:strand:+ start:268 stop:993 length:726 start_codon:yes stop_codon:yes gene_type:complete